MRLVPNVYDQEKNTEVCMASHLPSNGRISSQFHNFRLKLSAYAQFFMFFQSMWSKYEDSKNTFYDVIPN